MKTKNPPIPPEKTVKQYHEKTYEQAEYTLTPYREKRGLINYESNKKCFSLQDLIDCIKNLTKGIDPRNILIRVDQEYEYDYVSDPKFIIEWYEEIPNKHYEQEFVKYEKKLAKFNKSK